LSPCVAVRANGMSAISNSDLCFARTTIGIIGMSPGNVASLNLRITQEIARAGINLDQDHPEILAIGLPTSDIHMLKSAANLCKDFGADVIAVAGKIQKSILRATFSYLDLPIFAITEDTADFTALAVKVTARICKPHDAIRPDILYDISDEERIKHDLERDRVERDTRMRRRMEQGGYSILRAYQEGFVGVLGGAGPLASAAFLEKCTDFGVPYVCYSNTSAPSKNDFETGAGPSYIEHYKNSCYFFAILQPGAFVITCNTAHMRLEQYMEPYQWLYNRFVDIRSGVLDIDHGADVIGSNFVILGTSRTTGVGLAPHESGLYEAYRRKFAPGSTIVVPSESQQAVIQSAIVDAKAGRFSRVDRPERGPDDSDSDDENDASQGRGEHKMFAREKILSVVEEIRAVHGDIPVVFGCTELPLPFSMLELSHYGFFDPGQQLVECVRKFLSGPVVPRKSL
jgi:aspartate/glutamate racemase